MGVPKSPSAAAGIMTTIPSRTRAISAPGAIVLATAAILGGRPDSAAGAAPGPAEAIPAPRADAGVTPGGAAAVREPSETAAAAARASSLGNALDARRAAIHGPRHPCCHPREAKKAHARRVVLALAAEEARNRDAGLALDAYWSLAEAEHSLPEIEAAVASVEAAENDRAALAGRGLELPLDDATLPAKRLELDDARARADAGIASLSIALAHMAGGPAETRRTVDPAADRKAIEEPLDADALVAEGMAKRAELRMLRAALAHLDADTVDVGRMALALANPALGDDSDDDGHTCILLAHCRRSREEEARRIATKLRRHLADREAVVEAEIRKDTAVVRGAADRVPIAERQAAIAVGAAADKRARQGIGEVDAFAVHAADLEAAVARRAVVERLASWERARAKLRQAQGLLGAGDRPGP